MKLKAKVREYRDDFREVMLLLDKVVGGVEVDQAIYGTLGGPLIGLWNSRVAIWASVNQSNGVQ